MAKKENTLLVTRRLILLTGISLALVGAIFGIALVLNGKFMISWACILSGIIGGFVSIEQRLPKIRDEELSLLAESWFRILLVPIYGGIFALVLYVAFLAGIIEGKLFPAFDFPTLNAGERVTKEYIISIFKDTYPASGADFARLMLWSFIAGFSERFVPQMLATIADDKKL